MDRELDIVVFGATGDTGIATSCCLYYKGKQLGIKTWAPAARNLSKLSTELLNRLAEHVPGEDGIMWADPIEADSSNYESLLSMCKRTKCVIACAGPFAKFGEGVVRACVEAGTHYIDITGEVPWVEKMERKYGEEAEQKGVTLISMAGYDSVPPDLTTFLVAKESLDAGDAISRVDVFVGGGNGALPTGTVNTVLQGVSDLKSYALHRVSFGHLGSAAVPRDAPKKEPTADRVRGPKSTYVPSAEKAACSQNLFWTMCPGFSPLAKQFCIPHVMAGININVVHRTAALEGYGGFVYRERAAGLPSGVFSLYGLIPTIFCTIGVLGAAAVVAMPFSSSVILNVLGKYNAPKIQRSRDLMIDNFQPTGKTRAMALGRSKNGTLRTVVTMTCPYDQGLGFTALSACVVATTLLKNLAAKKKVRHGFTTAVSAVGGINLAKEFENAGVQLQVKTETVSKL